MAKQLLIEERDVPGLLEFYNSKRKKIADELEAVDSILAQLLYSTKNKENESSQLVLPQINGYPLEATWMEKIKFIVGKFGNATVSQVIEEIVKHEPKYASKRSSLLPTISGKMGSDAMSAHGVLNRDVNGSNIYQYTIKKPQTAA